MKGKNQKVDWAKLYLSYFAVKNIVRMYRSGLSPDEYVRRSAVAARGVTKIPLNRLWEAARHRYDLCAGCGEPVHRTDFYCGNCGGYLGGPEAFDRANARHR